MMKRRKTLSVYSEELERIARRDPLHPTTVKEKDLLMRLKEDCKTLHQTIIPRIIDCVNYKADRLVPFMSRLDPRSCWRQLFYAIKNQVGSLVPYGIKEVA